MRIGFVAKRISGTDGVSLEIEKWATVLERLGHTCYYIAGELDRPAPRSQLIPEAQFRHPLIQAIDRQCFGRQTRSTHVTADQMVERNYTLAQQYFSYKRVETELQALLTKPTLVPASAPETDARSNLATSEFGTGREGVMQAQPLMGSEETL